MSEVHEGLPRQKLLSSAAARAAAAARGLAVPDPNPAPEPPQSNSQKRYRERLERYTELILLFRQRWPAAFIRPWPLAIGIGNEIKAAFAGEIDPREIGRALKRWTSDRTYLSRLGTGKPRIALDGTPGEPATEEQQHDANARLLKALQRLGARRLNGGEP